MKGDVSEQKKKGKFTLDSFVRDGVFKAGNQDIGDIWAEQKKMRKEQIKLDRKKPSAPKISAKSKLLAIKKNIVLPKSATLRNKYILIVIIIGGIFILKATILKSNNTTSTLGVSESTGGQITEDNQIQAPDFSVVYPLGKSPETLTNVTRRSPDGSVIHTFKDEIDGIGIEVTQQKLPDNFKSAPAIELEKVAKNFQATNIIQIDGSVVFHGLQEKSGIQTLVTAKKDLLIFINSSQKQSDDTWVGYITSLK